MDCGTSVKGWRPQRSPIPIRARDVRGRRFPSGSISPRKAVQKAAPSVFMPLPGMDSPSPSGVVRLAAVEVVVGGLAALPTPSFCPPASALPIPSAPSVREQYAAEVALQQYVASGLDRPTEDSISPATPRRWRRHTSEPFEEKKRLGFGETPLKQIPAPSPLPGESGSCQNAAPLLRASVPCRALAFRAAAPSPVPRPVRPSQAGQVATKHQGRRSPSKRASSTSLGNRPGTCTSPRAATRAAWGGA